MRDMRHLIPSRNVIDKREANKGQATREKGYDNQADADARVMYGQEDMKLFKARRRAMRDPERRDPMPAILKTLQALLPDFKLGRPKMGAK